MANKYPYVHSAGPLVKTVIHLRKSFPKEVTAETLRKLGVAPKNESYVINVLRFLGIIDDEGKKVEAKAKAFVQHQDEAFAAEFEKLVKEAYEESCTSGRAGGLICEPLKAVWPAYAGILYSNIFS